MKVRGIFTKIFTKDAIKELNEEDAPKALQDESKLKQIEFGNTQDTPETGHEQNEQVSEDTTEQANFAQSSMQSHAQPNNIQIGAQLNTPSNFEFEIQKLARAKKNTKKTEGSKKIEIEEEEQESEATTLFDNFTNIDLTKHRAEKGVVKDIAHDAEAKDIKEHYLGHRSRLRNKVMQHGPSTLKDYELLELLLTYSIQRADVKPLAKNLLVHFKSLQTLFLADKAKQSKVKGIGESTLCFFSVIHEICCRMAREEIANEVLLNSPEKVINYCRLRMAGLSHEQFRVLFLNRKNKLILDETIQSGTIDKAAIFPRELVKRAIEIGAGAMILVHNHPSGDPTPSKADIESTINVQKAAELMEIFLYDHIIIGRNTHYSMRSNKII